MKLVAYVISEYPAVAHTFIQREVRGLRELGAEVATFSVSRQASDLPMSVVDREEARSTTVLRSVTFLRRVRTWASAVKHPRSLVTLMKVAIADGQLRLACDALVLHSLVERQGIKHLHAHFANEANDIARYAVKWQQLIGGEPWLFTFTMHGPTAFFDVTKYGIADKVQAADAIACISYFTQSQLLAVTAAESGNGQKLSVTYLGTDFDDSTTVAGERRPSGNHILCVGRLVNNKGQAILIRAVAALRDQGVPVTCTIIGTGPLVKELQVLVNELGLNDVVILAGAKHKDDVANALSESDVFCLPSFAEGLPVALMEAMAAGVPVVATNIAGTPELITNEVNGLLVPASDVEALTESLKRVLASPKLRTELATNAMETIKNGFTTVQAAERMWSFLSDANNH